jgi:hypothetical protein
MHGNPPKHDYNTVVFAKCDAFLNRMLMLAYSNFSVAAEMPKKDREHEMPADVETARRV